MPGILPGACPECLPNSYLYILRPHLGHLFNSTDLSEGQVASLPLPRLLISDAHWLFSAGFSRLPLRGTPARWEQRGH